MAKSREWPALEVRAAVIDAADTTEGLVSLALDDCHPLAIEDLWPLAPPPAGTWDPTAPPAPEPPPTPLAWRICFASAADRARAIDAIGALELSLVLRAVELPDEDWVARSQRALHAITAGRFVVAPPWDLPATLPAGARLIIIEPSMGFGTGHHATTRLCLRALGTVDVAGAAVLDLGTGSGVLALAAAAAAASEITGVDIDGDAIVAAEQSAALNPFGRAVRFRRGDVFTEPCVPVDLVMANLTGALLIRTARQLMGLVKANGALIVSGFMDHERHDVETSLSGFGATSHFAEDGWCALVMRRGLHRV